MSSSERTSYDFRRAIDVELLNGEPIAKVHAMILSDPVPAHSHNYLIAHLQQRVAKDVARELKRSEKKSSLDDLHAILNRRGASTSQRGFLIHAISMEMQQMQQ
ncbi:MAG: hypothetical protein ACD_67C00042G0003 [uncultured bacterium]|nr:MAG: hypothetical protein ACD_67C00042G0003 [uncultured bacterium]